MKDLILHLNSLGHLHWKEGKHHGSLVSPIKCSFGPFSFSSVDYVYFFRMPYAQCYGGHQFGMWAGQLGDGRAITLGELLNSKSERWELQLKGAGKTPYSRFADGLAVLRSSIREFLCSEAMKSLRIPTTRALCLVTTGKYVSRDMFYEYVLQSIILNI